MPLTMITVTGGANGWVNPDGSAASGWVLLAPVAEAQGGGYIVVDSPVRFTLVSGNISGQVVSNSQITGLQYLVTEQIAGATNPASYVVSPTGSTLDLSIAARGTLGVTTPLYVPLGALGEPGGVATLGSDGILTASQRPGGAGVTTFNGRSGAVAPASGDYTAALVTGAADKGSGSTQSFAGTVSAPAVSAAGLTGAVAASRYVGATASGAPVAGTFAIGDFAVDQAGRIWVCTTAGTPGTWVAAVASVSAADGTIVVAGTPTAPTVRVAAIAESQVTGLVSDLAGKVPTGRNVAAGTGLTGGGPLSGDVSLAVAYGTSAGTAAQGNDSRIVGALQSLTAADSSVTIGGTATAPTVKANPPVTSVAGKTGAVTLAEADVAGLTVDLAAKAPLASPTFTGTVTVPAPVNPTDPATKAYTDAVAQGLVVKTSVVAATTSNMGLSGTASIDGVTLTAGVSRVLLVGQTAASQNGIWVAQTSTWTRPADFASGSSQLGAFVFVEAGTANAASGWVLTGATAVIVDTTPQTWTQFSGAGEIIAGAYLAKSGNTLSAVPGVLGDIQLLGTAAAGGSGRAADAAHVHAMPRLDQVSAPSSSVGLNGQKITNVANGSAATDGAAFGQIPTTAAAISGQTVYAVTVTKTSNYAASAWQVVPCDATGGSFTVTLPTGATAGQQVTVKLLLTSGGNTVTVAAGGADVINQVGTTSVTLQLTSESFEFTANGSGVWVLASGQKSLGSLDARYLLAAGGTLTGSVTMQSSGTGGPDTSDSTSRLNLQSYQTNGVNFFGEVERRDLLEVYSKAMTAWRMPRPATGRGTDPIVFDSNSSFITDTSGYVTVGGAALSVSTLQHLVGTTSGRIDWATGAAGTQGISLAIAGLTVGHTYVAYVWAYIEATNPAVHIDVDGASASSATTVTGAWQRLTTTWVASSTTHNLRVVNDGAATSGQRAFVDLVYATSNLTGMRSVVWQGAHYAPQDMSNVVHGHWSVEIPDSSDNLQTRLEVLFTDASGNIGVDQGLVRIVQAALTVDTNNGNVIRLDAAPNVVRPIEWTTNSKWGGGTSQRWQLRANAVTESGGNAGSNLELARYSDSGVETDQPITVLRSSGRTTIGGASGTASGLTVNRNASGNTVLAANTANGGSGFVFQGNDTASISHQGSVGAEANPRVKLDLGGKLSFGPGGSTAVDTNLYRNAAGVLKTDGSVVVSKALTQTPQALTYSATVTTDVSTGNLFQITLTGNLTLANPTNPVDGQRVMWQFTQDGTGGRTLTLGAAFNAGPITVTLSTGANKVDYMGAIYRSAASKWDIVAFSGGY